MGKYTKLMNISDLKADLKKGDMIYKGVCHDCQKAVTVEAKVSEELGEITIEGGAVYKIRDRQDAKYFFKCAECFKNDKILRNYKECEVYSRVVGYLRPIQQWNKGKKAEFVMRKEFKKMEGL